MEDHKHCEGGTMSVYSLFLCQNLGMFLVCGHTKKRERKEGKEAEWKEREKEEEGRMGERDEGEKKRRERGSRNKKKAS